jgi:YhhN family
MMIPMMVAAAATNSNPLSSEKCPTGNTAGNRAASRKPGSPAVIRATAAMTRNNPLPRCSGPSAPRLLRARPALAAPYLAAFGALNVYLWKRTGRDRIPVIAYSAALLAMALTALDSGSPRTAAGGALFGVSDGLLALEKFGGMHLPAGEGLVMATYASAQALLAGPPASRCGNGSG